jgi:surface carbohydrate biosynthesis protein
MYIYIPIEVKDREIEGRSLLAIAAAERGHTVILGGKEDTIGLPKKGKLPPGIIHEKSLTPGPSKILRLKNLLKQGNVITSQDEESGLLDKSYENFAKSRFSEKTVSLASCIFTWGEHDANYLKNKYQSCEDKFIITGSPRVDLWRKEFAFYFTNKTQLPEIEGKRYILISSNFAGLLNKNRFWSVLANSRALGYFKKDIEKEYENYKSASFQIKLVGEFVRMIRTVSVEFPDIKILMRPHPVESVDAWKYLIGEYPNVIVKRKGTITGLIRQAEMVIHNGCTTALEASIIGTPRIAYRPVTSKYEREIPNGVSYEAFSLSECLDMVSAILAGNKIPGSENVGIKTEKIISSRFANISGDFAVDRIIREWEKLKLPDKSKKVSIFYLILIGMINRIRFILIDTAKFVLNRISRKIRKRNRGFVTKYKFPTFHRYEMSRLLKNYQKTCGRFYNVKFKKFGRRSFILYSKK